MVAGWTLSTPVQPEDIAPNNTPKIVGAVAVALMIGAAGVALYAHAGNQQPKPVVAASNLPPPPPRRTGSPRRLRRDAMPACDDRRLQAQRLRTAAAAPVKTASIARQ